MNRNCDIFSLFMIPTMVEWLPSSRLRSVAVLGHCNVQFTEAIKWLKALGCYIIAAPGDGRTPRRSGNARNVVALDYLGWIWGEGERGKIIFIA